MSQELFDAVAEKIVNELVSNEKLNTVLTEKLADYIMKSKIVNHLLATDESTVLSGPMGKELKGLLDVLNTNSSKVGHIHDERYYTETEIDGRFASLTTGETLLSILKYLPSKYLDDPPKYLNLSGYDIEIYVSRSQVTISGTGYWACVLGVHDNNNGNLKGAQVAITTGATYQRSFTYQSGWTSWGRL